MHSDEKRVAAAMAKKGEERKVAWYRLKCEGNYKYNVIILEKGRTDIIVNRTPHKNPDLGSYLPCIGCLGFFHCKELWRHAASCKCGPIDRTSIMAKGRLLLEGSIIGQKSSSDEPENKALRELKAHMKHDSVHSKVFGDQLVKEFGSVLLQRLGSKRKNDIAQRMRQLGRLLIADNQPFINEYISGKGFDKLVGGIYTLCERKESQTGVPVFGKPALALRLGHSMQKIALLKRGQALRNDDDVGYKECSHFLELYQSDWHDKVSSVAYRTLETNKKSEAFILPLTEDLKVLKIYVDEKIEELTDDQSIKSPDWYRELAEITMTKVALLNKRRNCEISQITTGQFQDRQKWQKTINQEICESLSVVEKKIISRSVKIRSYTVVQ